MSNLNKHPNNRGKHRQHGRRGWGSRHSRSSDPRQLEVPKSLSSRISLQSSVLHESLPQTRQSRLLLPGVGRRRLSDQWSLGSSRPPREDSRGGSLSGPTPPRSIVYCSGPKPKKTTTPDVSVRIHVLPVLMFRDDSCQNEQLRRPDSSVSDTRFFCLC